MPRISRQTCVVRRNLGLCCLLGVVAFASPVRLTGQNAGAHVSAAVPSGDPAEVGLLNDSVWRAPGWALTSPSEMGLPSTWPNAALPAVRLRSMPQSRQPGSRGLTLGTLLRISIGAAAGGFLGKLAADEACDGGSCFVDRRVIIGTFAAMGAMGGLILGPREPVPSWDSLEVDDPLWEQLRRVPVPASPPDTLPVWIYALENVSPPTRFVTRRYIPRIVIVAFHPSATVDVRQQAVDHVGGGVIGGEQAADGEGFYYLLIRDDSSGRGIRDAAKTLNGMSAVAVAGPRYVDSR